MDLPKDYLGVWETFKEVGYRTEPGHGEHTDLIAPDGELIGTYNLNGDPFLRAAFLVEEVCRHIGKSDSEGVGHENSF